MQFAALLTNVQVTPAGTTTQAAISGEIRGGPPGGSVILQASSDLGKADAWEDIGTIQLDAGGNVVFSQVPRSSQCGTEGRFLPRESSP